jgi:CBS domain-containing membrane protein
MMKLFTPLLAGASLRDRLIACLGALIGIGFVGMTCAELFPAGLPWLVAPMGATAVLLFAVPASPLAQPWPIVGGNIVSAVTGLCVAALVPDPRLAAALAVMAAILVMSLLRCLHPPGGAVALGAALAGPLTIAHAEAFLIPVAINSALLVAIAWFFHRYSGHSYPHRPVPVMWQSVPSEPQPSLLLADIDAALAELGETFDVSREDLALLLSRAEAHAEARSRARD